MKNRMEDFISENRDSFNSLEPRPESWDAILDKVKEQKTVKVREIHWQRWAIRVAAVLLISFVSIVVYETVKPGRTVNSGQIAEKQAVDPAVLELIEAEAWYTTQINERINELDKFSVGFEDIKMDVMNDMAELDTAYMELKQELGEDIYKQEVVESMIQNYRLKLEMLEDVLMQLKSVNETENEVNI